MSFQSESLSAMGKAVVLVSRGSSPLKGSNNKHEQFVVYAICKGVYNIYFHPLSVFPGPKWYAASHLAIGIATASGVLPFKIRRLHEKYGDVVRIAPDEITICSATALQDILNRPGLPKNPKMYTTSPNGVPSILTVTLWQLPISGLHLLFLGS